MQDVRQGPPEPRDRPTPVLLDIDNGMGMPVRDTDDAFALALALVSPEVELVGVTACAGNCTARESLVNTLLLLQAAGVRELPVGMGPEAPEEGERDAHFAYLDAQSRGPGARYWRSHPPQPATATSPDAPAAADIILRNALRHPGELVVVALGSLTNLALCCRQDPVTSARIARVVHMGGVVGRGGFAWSTPDIPDAVWRDTLRFNTLFDPEASATVFESGIPVTLVPADVTTRVFQRSRDLERLASAGDPLHRYLALWGRPWVRWSVEVRGLPGAHLHDPLTLAAVLRPSLFAFEAMAVDVDALRSGGRWLVEGPGGASVRVATGVDASGAESFLSGRLCERVLGRYRPGGGPGGRTGSV